MSPKHVPIIVCILAMGMGIAHPATAPDTTIDDAERLFAVKVWPLLQDKCLGCHGKKEEKIKGDFDMRTREGLLLGGESGQASIDPGDAKQSPLWIAVTWQNEDLQMPPKENDRLTVHQIGLLKTWINSGAPWPDAARRRQLAEAAAHDSTEGVRVDTSGGLSEEWTRRPYTPENLWAYQLLRRPTIPEPSPTSNPVDAFIDRKLQALELDAAPQADRRTLIRRATYDLTGLPPTPVEIKSFLENTASDEEAFRRVVDRLLESPQYGEQWGRHWLDVVRYADSSGLANDFERGNAWRYRDYVIRSFNKDKPYDQFIREQIAGDELDSDNPEMLVAVGFLRMGPWELTGMEVARVARQKFLDDVTDSVGQVFLSHPLQCAKCHDHKFDPIPTRDYYRMQAVFATTQFAERDADFMTWENTNGFGEAAYLLDRKQRYQASLQRIARKEKKAAQAWHKERGLDYLTRKEAIKRRLPKDQTVPRHIGLSVEDLGLERIGRKGIQRLSWELDRYQPYAFSVYDGRTPMLKNITTPLRMPKNPMTEGRLEASAILTGGDPFSPSQPVTPGVLSMLSAAYEKSDSNEDHAIPETIDGRRTALARWITDPRNPLVARSIVNRVWLWHFGTGIAGNANNFGAMGKKPTHPELLDWLAVTFMEEGWSFKKLHRRIMLSQTYRRSTHHPDRDKVMQQDPDGAAYAMFRPRRLVAEEMRDTMLAVSGELNLTAGGIPVRPEIHLEAALQPRMVMGTYAPAWQPSPTPEQRHRRSIYALKIRGLRDPFMEVFNQPGPDLSCEGRESSSVTPQVFSLFNSSASMNRAIAFANRLLNETVSEPAVIRLAFERAYGRPPDDDEMKACLKHWSAMTKRHRTLQPQSTVHPGAITREAVDENSGQRFKFTERLEFYADFVPDLKAEDVSPETRGLAEVCLVLMNANEFAYLY